MSDKFPTLTDFRRAMEWYKGLDPVDRALHDSEQRRSFIRGQVAEEPPPDVLADEVRRQRDQLSHYRALLAEAMEVLGPFADALASADQHYRKRGGEPDHFPDGTRWFDIEPTMLVKGKKTVAPWMRPLTLLGPFRAARALREKIERAMG